MTNVYDANLVIGARLDSINPDDIGYNEVEGVSLVEFMEGEFGMTYWEEDGVIGFEQEPVQDIDLKSALALQTVGRKFKHMTGVDAKLYSCLYQY